MGIYINAILVFIVVFGGLTYLLFWIPKKLGYPKVGKMLIFLFILFKKRYNFLKFQKQVRLII
jgi:hypothetical protein